MALPRNTQRMEEDKSEADDDLLTIGGECHYFAEDGWVSNANDISTPDLAANDVFKIMYVFPEFISSPNIRSTQTRYQRRKEIAFL